MTWTQSTQKSRRKVCRKVCRKVGNFVFLPAKNHMVCLKKKEKKKGVIFDDSRDLMLRFFFDSNILFTCAG